MNYQNMLQHINTLLEENGSDTRAVRILPPPEGLQSITIELDGPLFLPELKAISNYTGDACPLIAKPLTQANGLTISTIPLNLPT